jgi:hypothetical protein
MPIPQNHVFDLVCILQQFFGLVTGYFYDLCKAVHNWEVLSVDLYLCLLCPELLTLNGLNEAEFWGLW